MKAESQEDASCGQLRIKALQSVGEREPVEMKNSIKGKSVAMVTGLDTTHCPPLHMHSLGSR